MTYFSRAEDVPPVSAKVHRLNMYNCLAYAIVISNLGFWFSVNSNQKKRANVSSSLLLTSDIWNNISRFRQFVVFVFCFLPLSPTVNSPLILQHCTHLLLIVASNKVGTSLHDGEKGYVFTSQISDITINWLLIDSFLRCQHVPSVGEFHPRSSWRGPVQSTTQGDGACYQTQEEKCRCAGKWEWWRAEKEKE